MTAAVSLETVVLRGFKMNRLKFLIECFADLANRGRLQVASHQIDQGRNSHLLSFPEAQWPTQRSVAFKPFEFRVESAQAEAPEKSLLRVMVSSPESFYKISKIASTYGLDRELRTFFEEIKEVQQLHKGQLNLFDAFTQPGGHEAEAYFIRPECAMRHPDLYQKAIFSPTQSVVDDLTRLGMYRKVSQIAIPPGVPAESVREMAFRALQNDEPALNENLGIVRMTEPTRSMSVGDVFIIGSHGHLVKGLGFEQLSGFWPREPEAEVARHDVGNNGPAF